MRQELRFYRTDKAIEIEAEGQVIASIPMIETQQPEPQPKSIRYALRSGIPKSPIQG